MIVLAFWGAIVILAFAAEQGFVGLAAYVACWVLFFPVMLIVSIVVGVGVSLVASYEFGLLAKLRRGKEERIRARQQKMRKQLGYED